MTSTPTPAPAAAGGGSGGTGGGGSSGSLASTGFELTPLFVAAGATLLLGLGLLVSAARRPQPRHSAK
ncbi:hypothetical protein [Herbiconiux daphne]|uniref:hypothetical protein n=1 Tax=Herbiconiux daphne TaxID=2970914 RepID=UPI0028772C76|nr:hypothetical protein [Herbiconiux daphne]